MDVLALLVRLKELADKGNKQAKEWFKGNSERLVTEEAKKLTEILWRTDSQEWWKEVREKLHREYRK